jgi:flagellar protein FliS
MVAQNCARMYRANSVLTASPGQLVLMLYDGALRSMALARLSLAKPPREDNGVEHPPS